jgi:hypothetical protein
MPTIRERWLPILDLYRAKLDTTWDLRRFSVVLHVTTWSGAAVGEGTAGYVETTLGVNGGAKPKVVQLSQRDILASGGLYQDQDLRVGPLTPYSAGFTAGVDPSTFDPAPGGPNVEIRFKLFGPGLGGAAGVYKKVGQEVTGNFGLYLVLRKTGEQNP